MLDAFDVQLQGRNVRLIRYADDFLVLCKSEAGAERAMQRAKDTLAELGLSLNPDKTRITDFDEGFRFLGHRFVRSLVLASPNADQSVLPKSADDTQPSPQPNAKPDAHWHPKLRLVYVNEPDRRVSVSGQSLVVEQLLGKDQNGLEQRQVLGSIHVRQIRRIELGPGVEIDAAALRFFAGLGLPISFVNSWGALQSQLVEAQSLTGGLQLAQAAAVLDQQRRMRLARALVLGRVRNQRAVLRRLNRKRKRADVLRGLEALNRATRWLEADTTETPSIDVLMGK